MAAALESPRETVYRTFSELVALHSPSGVEAAVDAYLLERLAEHGDPVSDGAGNIVLRIEGRDSGPLRSVLAHKDEIGAIVKRVNEHGRLSVSKLGGSFPWIWGEGPVDVLGRNGTIPGVLSFGARHVSDESDQKRQQDEAGVRWRDAWVETKLDAAALTAAGVRPGSRVVPSAARKRPVRLGADGEYVASYAIDDKGAVAGLLELAGGLVSPPHPVELVFTAREEIGCHGAKWYASRTAAEAAVAFEVTPVAEEYRIDAGPDPVLVVADSLRPLDDSPGRGARRRRRRGRRQHAPCRALRVRLGRVRRAERRHDRAHRLPGLRHRKYARLRDRPPRRDHPLRGRSGALASG